jgi:hypothetical protein
VGATQVTNELPTVKLGRKDYSLADAEALCRRNANGFFYISGLSLINMIIATTGSNFTTSLGLELGVDHLTQVLAAATDNRFLAQMSHVVTAVPVALFALLGWRARQIEYWSFRLGWWLYVADGMLLVKYDDYQALGIHLFLLAFLTAGMVMVPPIQAVRRRLSASRRSDDVAPVESAPLEQLPGFLRVANTSSTPSATIREQN